MQTEEHTNIDSVWQKYEATRNVALRNTLLEHYLPLVKATASRMHSRLPKSVQLDDINSAGVFGLVDAVASFDPKVGVKFETYCAQRIRGAILDELRKNDWVPRLVRQRARLLTNATQTLKAIHGGTPSDEELGQELGMDMPELSRLRQDAATVWLGSLETGITDNSGDDAGMAFSVPDNRHEAEPLNEAQKHDIKQYMEQGLSRMEKLVLVLYYYEEMTMKEVGVTLGISESRISQIHSGVLNRFRTQMESREYELVMDDTARPHR